MKLTSYPAAILVVAMTLYLVALSGCSSPRLECRPTTPAEFLNQSVVGQAESQRYERAYRAFWWCCVQFRADDLQARCPFICSGTPAAAQGCADGSIAAQTQIDALVVGVGPDNAASQLRSLLDSAEYKTLGEEYVCVDEGGT